MKKNTMHKHKKTRSSKGISISVKVLLLTLILSTLVWKALDIIQSKDIREFFYTEHAKEQEKQSRQDFLLFKRHVQAHHQEAKLIVSLQGFQTYVSSGAWLTQSEQKIFYHDRPAPWLPELSMMNSLFHARYALLADAGGQVREIYHNSPKEPPQAVLEVCANLLRKPGHNQAFMTAIDGLPYAFSFQSVRDADEQTAATLLLVSPMDGLFLKDSQGFSPAEGVVVALLMEDLVLASSDMKVLPAGSLIDDVEEQFLSAGTSFFDKTESDLEETTFGSFVATEKLDLLAEQVLQKIKAQRAVFAAVLMVLFVLLIIWITRRIKQVTQRIVTFSTDTLGIEIPWSDRDELRQLFHAIQSMVASLAPLIEDIVQVSQGLAKGDLQVRPKAEYKGNFIRIKKALNSTLAGLRLVIADIVQVSQGLAKGSLQVAPKTEYHGDFVLIKDALESTSASLCYVIEDIVQASQGLANGKQHIISKDKYRGDFVRIKDALEAAGGKLADTTAKTYKQDWLKTGQTQLNEQMSGKQDIVTLAKNIIVFLSTYLGAKVGIFYLAKQNGERNPRLKMISSYAYVRRKGFVNEFELGEGLVGQAGLERQSITVNEVPDDYIRIQSGLGHAVPKNIAVVPFLYENTLAGVVELGFLQELTELQLEFLNQVMPTIGITVNTTEAHTKMQELLLQSQAQAEKLQAQSQEMRDQQEKLQQTNEELQSQSEELQIQQEELRQTNEELQERTRDLEKEREAIRIKNRELEKTQAAIQAKAEELELASKYKSEFLANMSHELRTPLNSLLILAQLLANNKENNLTEKQLECAHTIHSAGADLLTLINEILDLSKVEAGKVEIHPENLAFADLACSLEEKFRYVAEEKSLSFAINMAPDLPAALYTDPMRLVQIINNLLSNAFKFTAQGGVTLEIRHPHKDENLSQSELDPARSIAFSVSDTGIGIPADKQKIIFKAFQQVDGTTSRSYGGTGLGLSISRQLALLMGGEIHLYSEEGKGSCFTVYLAERVAGGGVLNTRETAGADKLNIPAKITAATIKPSVVDVPRLKAPQRPETNDDRASLQAGDKSILIIEDDHKFSRILADLAREKNFKCLAAGDGKHGLQLVEKYRPSAIMLDIGLPQADGWTVMERLKDNPDTRHIPVHFVSASECHIDARRMGAIGYSLKPASMAELGDAFKKIDRFISKKERKLLVIADTEQARKEILEVIDNDKVEVTAVRSDAVQHLDAVPYDCIIVDMNAEQDSCIQLFELLHAKEKFAQVPVIAYAERDLTQWEDAVLQQYAGNLTIKEVHSRERLLDEATLFLHQVEAQLPEEQRQMLRMAHDKEAVLADRKILLVDDDLRNVFALGAILEDKGMEVVIGQNGKEALNLLDEHKDIELVLMDIMMPKMDGYKAMRRIRKQAHFHKLPIIALTAKAMKDDRAKCIEAGASDYLAKPIDADKLLSLMRVWLYH
ncbi:MAG: response regulator [Gammaproteobacteria bacterium]|nr:response regulator [Gammaproteobacteria bacterium]